MQGYAPACRDEAFTGPREQFAEMEEWLAGEAAGLQHAELEEQLDVRGREMVRRLFQGHLDLLAAREERRDDVAGEDGVARHGRVAGASGARALRRLPLPRVG
jgi:hypothetical protein